jgi:hypothetical protein
MSTFELPNERYSEANANNLRSSSPSRVSSKPRGDQQPCSALDLTHDLVSASRYMHKQDYKGKKDEEKFSLPKFESELKRCKSEGGFLTHSVSEAYEAEARYAKYQVPG